VGPVGQVGGARPGTAGGERGRTVVGVSAGGERGRTVVGVSAGGERGRTVVGVSAVFGGWRSDSARPGSRRWLVWVRTPSSLPSTDSCDHDYFAGVYAVEGILVALDWTGATSARLTSGPGGGFRAPPDLSSTDLRWDPRYDRP
jgi:hypothetical protein